VELRDIRIGIGIQETGHVEGGLEALLADFRAAEGEGFQTAWVANIFGMDAMTLVALAGRETSRLELGTAVVPTFSRHPFYLAQQALSTQAATGGRFVCGLGPSHRVVVENLLGLSYEKPARHVREYVRVVKELVETGRVAFDGEVYHVRGALRVPDASPMPVLIGALGPLMRRIAGELCDGTITWMTGPRTLGDTIGPDVRAAAREAGRPEPRIVAGLPICLTDDPHGARESAAKAFAIYGTLPSYRAMLDAEGLAGPGDLAVTGDEKAIEEALRGLAAAGVTDFQAALFAHGPDRAGSAARTRALLAELART
jgi:5,10-methylenetetrahydromethanopterin reductase